MSNIIKCLEKLNKKERHHLVLQLLGKDVLPISDELMTNLSREISVDIPDNPYVAIDYQLNWIERCLRLPDRKTVQDIDLLIAFELEDGNHLVFVEVKGPSTGSGSGWTNKQMGPKAQRLKKIFGNTVNKSSRVTPHFCLLSPKKPKQLKTDCWPTWMKKSEEDPYFWVKLNLP